MRNFAERRKSCKPGPACWAFWLLVLVMLAPGCTRRFYRTMADKDVVGIMTQKNQFPAWGIDQWHVYPDPRARYADPTNPDRPPRPPDDLAAHVLSPNPQPPRRAGVGNYEGDGYMKYLITWDQQNRAARAEAAAKGAAAPDKLTPPAPGGPQPADAAGSGGGQPRAPSPDAGDPALSELAGGISIEPVFASTERPFVITLGQACELALFNCREFQDRREDLYLAALPVSLQRYAFIAQFFATETAIRQAAGLQAQGGGGNLWQLNSTTGFNRLFPSGATLLVQLANQLVINLGNGKPDVGISTLTVQLAQPLLRGGGFAVTLEPLTQAERTLLYAIRSYARFRKLFFNYLAGGTDLFNAPYSFAGLSLRGVGPSLNAPSQGYLPTLLLAALERNERANLATLQSFFRQFQAFEEGGDISALQVNQVFQQILNSQSSLLGRRLTLRNGLDAFKLQLGVPTCLVLELDDEALRPVYEQMARFIQVRDEFDAARQQAADAFELIRRPLGGVIGGFAAVVPVEVRLRAVLERLFTQSALVRGTQFVKTIEGRWGALRKLPNPALFNRMRDLGERRRRLLDLKALMEVRRQPFPAEAQRELDDIRDEINLGRFEQSLRLYETRPWVKAPPGREARDQAALFRDVVNLFTLVLSEARTERLEAVRKAWPDLPRACLKGVDLVDGEFDRAIAAASQYALSNRFELMNTRAQLVDSWRQIKVRANALLGVLNVQYHMDTLSPANANEPLSLGGSRTRHQLILNGELPLIRRSERNDYRTALVAFQRQRRALQATEDFILNDVRTDIRQLRVFAENYKIQQRAVEVAYAQVENSLDVLYAPPDPRSAAGGQTAGNAAALTNQLLGAQNSLLAAQNNLCTVWINYLVQRIQLYRDLELLPLDARGVWIDEHATLDCEPGSCGDGRPGGQQSPGAGERQPVPERLPEPRPLGDPGAAPRTGE